jgi:outer membrane PBP1 activator LpoA protein
MLRRALPALLVAVLGVSACGGDDDKKADRAAATPTPAPEWVQQANDACAKSQQQVTALAPDVAKEEKEPAKAAALVIERSIPIEEAMFAKLETIDVPSDVKADYDEWREQLESSLDLFPDLAAALRAGKEDPELTKRAQELAKTVQPFADKYGVANCVAPAPTG